MSGQLQVMALARIFDTVVHDTGVPLSQDAKRQVANALDELVGRSRAFRSDPLVKTVPVTPVSPEEAEACSRYYREMESRFVPPLDAIDLWLLEQDPATLEPWQLAARDRALQRQAHLDAMGENIGEED